MVTPTLEAPAHDETPRVLVVDDEQSIREILSDFLTMEGYLVRTAADGAEAVRELSRRPYHLVLSDLKMPDMGGLKLLDKMAELRLPTLCVIMTGFGTVETAIAAMKSGAHDYILKPFKMEEVVHIVRKALLHQRLQAENLHLREAVSLYRISEAVASSLSLETIFDVIIDATLQEIDADVITLHLEDPRSGRIDERVRRARQGGEAPADGDLDFEEVLQAFYQHRPLLAHGARALRYFRRAPEARRLVSFCSIPLKVHHRVTGFLCAYSFARGKKFTEGQRKMLAILGSRAAASIENARLYESLKQSHGELETAKLSLEENFRQTIQGFAHALEESDRYTRGHSERVSQYARLIADGLQLGAGDCEMVVRSALMHDIGKIGIRHEKLNKQGRLTAEEMAMFRTHPAKGKRILEPIPFLRDLIPGCYCHHEAWDGSGYPEGLLRDRIPTFGRIIAIADTYDAMTSDRAYRKALPHAAAADELGRCAGAQFDQEIVKLFLHEIERYRKRARDSSIEVPR
jgi:response regulator RpfG family c-di-GMP phosphodiesterase